MQSCLLPSVFWKRTLYSYPSFLIIDPILLYSFRPPLIYRLNKETLSYQIFMQISHILILPLMYSFLNPTSLITLTVKYKYYRHLIHIYMYIFNVNKLKSLAHCSQRITFLAYQNTIFIYNANVFTVFCKYYTLFNNLNVIVNSEHLTSKHTFK